MGAQDRKILCLAFAVLIILVAALLIQLVTVITEYNISTRSMLLTGNATVSWLNLSIGSTIAEEGSLATAASYVVFTDGTTTYAKNGTTGQIEFSGADAAMVIGAAIGALPTTGGKIALRSGTFILNSSIVITKSYVIIQGEGWGSTTVILANGVDDSVFRSDLLAIHDLCCIRDLKIDGNGANQAFGKGIDATGLRKSVLDSLWIENAKEDGIYASETVGIAAGLAAGNSDNVNIYNSIITNNGDDGVHLEGSSGSYIDLTWSVTNTNRGFFIWGKGDQILNLYAEDNSQEGVYLQGLTNAIGYIFSKSNGDVGLFLAGVYKSTLDILLEDNADSGPSQNNEMYMGNVQQSHISGKISTATIDTDGIRLQSYDGITCSAVLSLSMDVTRYGLTFVSGGTDSFAIVFSGGRIIAPSGAIHNPGAVSLTDCLIRGNLGYVTEKHGTASVTGAVNSVVVNHNLSTSPDIVVVSPLQTGGGNVWVSSKNAVNFTINFDNQPGGGVWYFDWYAEA